MLQCGIHPPKLWITLWVSEASAAQSREKPRFSTECHIFEQHFFFVKQ
jgi:hypothetical protein